MIDAIKQLETKQKVILVVTVALFAFVIFYGYETFFGDGDTSASSPASAPSAEEAPPPQPSPKAEPAGTVHPKSVAENPNRHTNTVNGTTENVSANNAMPASGANQGWQQGNAQPTAPAAPPPMAIQAPLPPTPEQLALLKESQEVQQEYLRLVNEYQLAQLKQKLEQANADIAQAKLRSAQTMAQIQLLADKLKDQNAPALAPTATVSTTETRPSVTYQLMYVGKQSGQWTAMLSSGGAYFEVNEGTRLSDGSVVKEINQKGMVLTRNGAKEYLTISKGLD